MTKKHFEAIASILAEAGKTADAAKVATRDEIMFNLSDYFRTVNPAFDANRFQMKVLKGSYS